MRLLGQLASRGYLFSPEVAATLSLAILLEDAKVEELFLSWLDESVDLPRNLAWEAEVATNGRGRIDLVGSTSSGPVVAIEAKLGARFRRNQLGDYALWLIDNRSSVGAQALVALVPESQVSYARSQFNRTSRTSNVVFMVLSWESLLERLLDAPELEEPIRGDLHQLQSVLTAASRATVGPFPSGVTVDSSVRRELERLVDLVTRAIPDVTMMPLSPRIRDFALARYHQVFDEGPWLAVGIPLNAPDQFSAELLWARMLPETPKFRLAAEAVSQVAGLRNVEDASGALWFPLDIDPEIQDAALIASVVDQILAIHDLMVSFILRADDK